MIVKFHFSPLMVVDSVKLVNLWWGCMFRGGEYRLSIPKDQELYKVGLWILGGVYERSKTKHFDPRRRCRHNYWQRMVNNLPTSCTQELLVSSMETNNWAFYAIDGIDPTRIFLHQDKVSIHCGQLIDKRSGNPISHRCLQC